MNHQNQVILLIMFASIFVVTFTIPLELAYGKVCTVACLRDVPTAVPIPILPSSTITPSIASLNNSTVNVTIINQTK